MPSLKDLLNVRKGGLLDQWSGYAPSTPDRSVMDAPRPIKSLLPDPADDAIGPPTVLGGLLSLDPTDYVGPGTIGKLAAALKGLGGVGMLPAIGGVIRDIPSPKWNTGRMSIPVGVDPTSSELKELMRDVQSINGSLRRITVKDGSSYLWPADAALHDDVMQFFKIHRDRNPKDIRFDKL